MNPGLDFLTVRRRGSFSSTRGVPWKKKGGKKGTTESVQVVKGYSNAITLEIDYQIVLREVSPQVLRLIRIT